jgi:hypothetical protein
MSDAVASISAPTGWHVQIKGWPGWLPVVGWGSADGVVTPLIMDVAEGEARWVSNDDVARYAFTPGKVIGADCPA